MTTKTTGRAGWHQATPNTTDDQNLTALMHWKTTIAAIKRHIWLIGYEMEEARRSHEDHGRYFRRLACCIGLAALRLLTGGPRHV